MLQGKGMGQKRWKVWRMKRQCEWKWEGGEEDVDSLLCTLHGPPQLFYQPFCRQERYRSLQCGFLVCNSYKMASDHGGVHEPGKHFGKK